MKKYRVWDSVTEIMYYPEDFKLVIDHGEPELHLQRKLGVVVAKENDIGKSAYLMQSTGLKDKNGVEIYEGDIIKGRGGVLSVVEYITEDACFKATNKYQVTYISKGYLSKYAEIVGNIYENPELLEENKCKQ